MLQNWEKYKAEWEAYMDEIQFKTSVLGRILREKELLDSAGVPQEGRQIILSKKEADVIGQNECIGFKIVVL